MHGGELDFAPCIPLVLELLMLPTISKRLDRRFFLLIRVAWRRKYFWAWLATWVGVLVVTNVLDIPLQSPFPSFSSPTRNVLCSSSVQGTPFFLSWQGPIRPSDAYPVWALPELSSAETRDEDSEEDGEGNEAEEVEDRQSMLKLFFKGTRFRGGEEERSS